jgi:hypothetical protein
LQKSSCITLSYVAQILKVKYEIIVCEHWMRVAVNQENVDLYFIYFFCNNFICNITIQENNFVIQIYPHYNNLELIIDSVASNI